MSFAGLQVDVNIADSWRGEYPIRMDIFAELERALRDELAPR